MTATLRDRRHAFREFVWFGALTTTIYATWIAIIHTSRFDVRSDVLSWGAAFDLTVTVPFVYWLFVVRRAKAPGRSIVAVIALSVIGARLLLPSGHAAFLSWARFATAPAELGILILAVHRLRIARRLGRLRDADMLTQLGSTLTAIVGYGTAGRALGHEASIFYYAFASRQSPTPNADALTDVQFADKQFAAAPPFATSVFVSVLGIVTVETAALHLLVAQRSVTVAWLLTGLSVYSAIWLVAFQRSFSSRFSVIGSDALTLRVGLRCSASIPWANIASITSVAWRDAPAPGSVYLNFAKPGDPNVLLEFHNPVRIEGPYGIPRTASQLAMRLERPETFIAHVAARAPELHKPDGVTVTRL